MKWNGGKEVVNMGLPEGLVRPWRPDLIDGEVDPKDPQQVIEVLAEFARQQSIDMARRRLDEQQKGRGGCRNSLRSIFVQDNVEF